MENVPGGIGNTPLVELRKVEPPGAGRVVVKLEWANPIVDSGLRYLGTEVFAT